MRKILVMVVLVLTFGVYAFKLKSGANRNDAIINISNPGSSQSPSSTNMGMMGSANMGMGKYKNGMYQGPVVDAYYGNVQVEVAIQNGLIRDVQFLQYPNDRSTSIEINTGAMPQLRQEAIATQNSQVDIVSGATQTSEAFRQSLADALTQAQ